MFYFVEIFWGTAEAFGVVVDGAVCAGVFAASVYDGADVAMI